jgi:hypothetical protein
MKRYYRKSIRNLHALGLADDNANVNACRKDEAPALIWATGHGTAPVVKALLALGANVHGRDKLGRTALHYAARNGQTFSKQMQLLIAAGADVNTKDDEGYTPLMMAQGASTIRMLLNRRPKMTLQEEVETTLQPLLGQPLSDMWRAAGMQIFEIGVQRPCKNRRGQEITRADWSLHVSCCWYIMGPKGDIVSSSDFGPDGSRRDEQAKPFYGMLGDPALTIITLQSDGYGGINLGMSGGYNLAIWPPWENEADREGQETDEEQWRLLSRHSNMRHFVILAHGKIQRY